MQRGKKEGSYKINVNHIKFIKDTLKKDNTITMSQLHTLIKNKFKDLEVSRQYLSLDNNNNKQKFYNFLDIV